MQCDHAARYILTAHEVTINIIYQLVAINITVIVGSRNTLRMVLKQTGNKRAYNIIISFEGLVNGWWLVHPSRDGFKVVNTESERIAASVPPYHIKRMMTVMNAIHSSFFLCSDQEITFFVDCNQFFRSADIAFAIWRMFKQLAIFTQVFFWKADRAE